MKYDLREKIMEAIWENGAAGQSEARAGADAALSAIHDAGYVILPRVLTPEMENAADRSLDKYTPDMGWQMSYTAMIAAAEGEA